MGVGGGVGGRFYQSLSSAGRGVMMCVFHSPKGRGMCLSVRRGLCLSSSTQRAVPV